MSLVHDCALRDYIRDDALAVYKGNVDLLRRQQQPEPDHCLCWVGATHGINGEHPQAIIGRR